MEKKKALADRLTVGFAAILLLSAPSLHARARTPTGPGSLAGVWVKSDEPFGNVDRKTALDDREHVLKTADGTPLPTLPWATAIVDKRLDDAEAGRPFASLKTQCLPQGVPDMMFGYGPMQILENPGQVTVLRQEFQFFRIIRVNGSHPKDLDPTFLGDSVGRWVGGDFVVDTLGVTDRTTVKFMVPHSEAMHVIERYHRTDADTLDIEATIDDPKTFSRPWTMTTRLKRLTGGLKEYFCENNRNPSDGNGHVTVQMPSASH